MNNLRKARAVRAASCSLAALVAASSLSAQGWLAAPQRIASTPQTAGYHIAKGDRDLDGDVDLVQVVGATITVRTNQGTGTFVPGATFALPPGFVGPFVGGDYDGDGRTDLVLTALPFSSAGSAVVVLPTAAGGGFAAPIAVPLPPGALVERLVRGDANGDGVDDVCIVTIGGGALRRAQWLLGDVNRAFVLAAGNTIPSGQGSLVDDLTTFDADGDGLSDLAVLGDGLVQVLVTNGAVPTPSTSIPVAFATGPAWLCASDLDGDLDDDLVVVGPFGQGLRRYVLSNQGGAFVTQSVDFPSLSAGPVLATDWNEDGSPDVFLRSGSGLLGTTGYSLWSGDGAGALTLAWSRPFFVPSQLPVGFADLDGDQHLDFVDAGAVLFGDGTGEAPGGGPDARQNQLLDWEGDGDLDVFAASADNTPLVWRNDGNGEFAALPLTLPPTPLPDQTFRTAVATADFDGDGLQELLVPLALIVNPFPPVLQFVAMHRLEHDGSGGLVDLGPATAPGVAIVPPCFAVDTDQDGDLDVVDRSGVFVLTGSTFAPVPQAFAGFVPLAAGDVDGDGDTDLVGGFQGTTNGLAILRLVGPNAFAVDVVQPTSGSSLPSQGLALADVDDDGDLDLIADPTTNGGAPRIWRNQGGTFLLAATIPIAGETSGTPMAADVDGDGLTDLAYSSGNGLAVLRRTSPLLTYDPPVRFAIQADGFVDIDQDGDPDPIGSWNRNRTFSGSAAGVRRQFGISSLGSGGRRPVLSAVGIVRAGSTPTLRLRQALGGGLSLLALGSTPSSVPLPAFPGLVSYVVPADVTLGLVLQGPSMVAGAGAMDLPLALHGGLIGLTVQLQQWVLDPAGVGSLVQSNGLELTIGG